MSEEEARGFTKKLEEKSKRFGKGSFTISVIACAGTERIVRVDGVRRQGVAVKAYSTSSHELKSIVKKLKKLRKKLRNRRKYLLTEIIKQKVTKQMMF